MLSHLGGENGTGEVDAFRHALRRCGQQLHPPDPAKLSPSFQLPRRLQHIRRPLAQPHSPHCQNPQGAVEG